MDLTSEERRLVVLALTEGIKVQLDLTRTVMPGSKREKHRAVAYEYAKLRKRFEEVE